MKKLTALALTVCMVISLAVSNVQASGRINGIYEAISGQDEIHIIYNDAVVKYEDVKPVNTDGRVMIPFRAALENMGAKVDYNDAEREVTATKGDITIRFTLMDDTIYIDNNGQKSTITMDVPMIIVQDRTLVPIRFMSNAFGMQVGWDGETQTVVIMDYDDYFDDFAQIAPNMSKLASQKTDMNKGSLTFDVRLNTQENGENASFTASGSADAKISDTASEANLTLTLASGDKNVFDGAKADVVISGSKIYIKTDAMNRLALGDGWYSIDAEKLFGSLGLSEDTAKLFNAVMHFSNNAADMTELLKSGVSLEGDADFMDTVTLATILDMYEELDQYITVTEKDNGGFSANVNITPEQFANIINKALNGILTDEEKSMMQNNASYKLSANIDNDGTKQSSKADLEVKINAEGTVFNLKAVISENAEKDGNAAQISVPSSAIDITDTILKML